MNGRQVLTAMSDEMQAEEKEMSDADYSLMLWEENKREQEWETPVQNDERDNVLRRL